MIPQILMITSCNKRMDIKELKNNTVIKIDFKQVKLHKVLTDREDINDVMNFLKNLELKETKVKNKSWLYQINIYYKKSLINKKLVINFDEKVIQIDGNNYYINNNNTNSKLFKLFTDLKAPYLKPNQNYN